MKEIYLTKGQVAKVSDHRFEYLNQWEWYASWNKDTQSFYAARTEGKFPFKKIIYMHRQIMNTPKGMICDHIDHDTLNYQDDNLRNVTPSESAMNRRLRRDNKLGEKCIRRKGNGFEVNVYAGGKRVFCKYFRTLEEAVVARNEAVKKHHGYFAYFQE